MEGMRKVFLVAAVSLVVGLAVVAPAAARPPWTLLGNATFVKEGQGDNPWAVKLTSDIWLDVPWGAVRFLPTGEDLTFVGIWLLSTDYHVTDDDCGGGSPRFQVAIDLDWDGDRDGNLFIYIGPHPNFRGCAPGWQSTGDLTEATDARFDLTQLGGPFYGTYGQALEMLGGTHALRVSIVVDSGWMFLDGEQTILVDNVAVNDHLLDGHGAVSA